MIDLSYSLVIEATAEPDFFGFYSPDLEPSPDPKITIQNAKEPAIA